MNYNQYPPAPPENQNNQPTAPYVQPYNQQAQPQYTPYANQYPQGQYTRPTQYAVPQAVQPPAQPPLQFVAPQNLFAPVPYPQYPPYGKIYNPKYGWIEPQKLQKKQLRRDVNLMSLVTLGMFAMSLIFGVIMGLFMGLKYSTLLQDSEFYYALSAATVIFGTALPFVIYLLVAKPDLSSLIHFDKVNVGTAILFAIAGAGLCLASNFPAQWVSSLLEYFGMNAGGEVETVSTPLAAVLMFFGIAVLPPIFEEFAFRGVVLSSLRKYGDGFAIITSAIIFGLMHMSLTSIPFAVLAGIVMGFIYVKTGNIWVNIAVHMLNNAIACFQSISYSFMPEATADVINTALFYGFMLAGLIAIIVLAVTKKLNFKFQRPQMMISSGDKFLCAAVNPGLAILFVLCMGVALMSALGTPIV